MTPTLFFDDLSEELDGDDDYIIDGRLDCMPEEHMSTIILKSAVVKSGLQADSCHNWDRIKPSSVHWPPAATERRMCGITVATVWSPSKAEASRRVRAEIDVMVGL